MKLLVTTVLIVLLTSSAMSQQPYAGLQNRSIKTLSDQQIADLNDSRGMGLALAAELNGYPGPIHAIELAEQLRLSPDQVDKLKSLFEAMKAETIPLGATLISEERSLNEDFANRTVTLRSLKGTTERIGTTQAALRVAHLKYHLSTVEILTADQVTRYNDADIVPVECQPTATTSIISNGQTTYPLWVKSGHVRCTSSCLLGPKADICGAARSVLFDYLIRE